MECLSLWLLALSTVPTVAQSCYDFPSGNNRHPGSPVPPFCDKFAWNATISPWFGSKQKWSAHYGSTLGRLPARVQGGDDGRERHEGAPHDPLNDLVRPARVDRAGPVT